MWAVTLRASSALFDLIGAIGGAEPPAGTARDASARILGRKRNRSASSSPSPPASRRPEPPARQGAPADPTADLAPKKPAMKPPETLTRDDMTRLLVAAAWRNPRRAWALMLTYSIGARRMEVAAIRPEDVDLEGRTVYLATTKGDRPRRVELGHLALAALEGLRPWGETVVGVGAATLHHWMNVAARDAELPRAKWKLHGLRATFATDLLDRGTPISVVSTCSATETSPPPPATWGSGPRTGGRRSRR
jgi:integrase